jgi:hypothetical protein
MLTDSALELLHVGRKENIFLTKIYKEGKLVIEISLDT